MVEGFWGEAAAGAGSAELGLALTAAQKVLKKDILGRECDREEERDNEKEEEGEEGPVGVEKLRRCEGFPLAMATTSILNTHFRRLRGGKNRSRTGWEPGNARVKKSSVVADVSVLSRRDSGSKPVPWECRREGQDECGRILVQLYEVSLCRKGSLWEGDRKGRESWIPSAGTQREEKWTGRRDGSVDV